jgi:hypothetical protein
MILTPSNTGSLIAGAGIGAFSWSAFLKIDKIPVLKRLVNQQRKEKTLGWMNKNKGLSLLGLEAVNFGIHGITSATAVIFALGNTVFNIVMLFLYLPFRQRRVGREQIQTTLKGRKA